MGKTKSIEQVIQDIEESVEKHGDKEDKEFKTVGIDKLEIRLVSWGNEDFPIHIQNEMENVLQNIDVSKLPYSQSIRLTENFSIFKYHFQMKGFNKRAALLSYREGRYMYMTWRIVKDV